jgi:hypothetical protein
MGEHRQNCRAEGQVNGEAMVRGSIDLRTTVTMKKARGSVRRGLSPRA